MVIGEGEATPEPEKVQEHPVALGVVVVWVVPRIFILDSRTGVNTQVSAGSSGVGGQGRDGGTGAHLAQCQETFLIGFQYWVLSSAF